MRRLASFLAALFFAATLSTVAVAKPHDHGNSMNAPGHMMAPGQMRKGRCGPGHHWVNGYKKRNGQWVKGYCR
jgi:hypothetical protein